MSKNEKEYMGGIAVENLKAVNYGQEKKIFANYGKDTSRCAYCGNRGEMKTGVCLSYDYEPFSQKYTFYRLGLNLCCFACRFSYCEQNQNLPGWKDTVTITQREFGILYPGKKLSKAPPRPFLKSCGGPIEFISEEFSYESPPIVEFVLYQEGNVSFELKNI